MVVVSWIFADSKPEYSAAAQQDAAHIAEQLPTLIAHLGLPISTITRYAMHEGKLVNSQNAASTLAAQWRTLFAQAVIKLEHQDDMKDLA